MTSTESGSLVTSCMAGRTGATDTDHYAHGWTGSPRHGDSVFVRDGLEYHGAEQGERLKRVLEALLQDESNALLGYAAQNW
jgi:hypothetical protein